MNVRKDLVIAVLLGFFLAITLYPQVVGVGEYDPWSDINSDGKMRVDDILDVALRFGSDGDPTRNVTVVNWPTSSDVTVWWEEILTPSDWIISSIYSAAGFGQLHILARGTNLGSGEKITIYVACLLWNPAHTGYIVTYVELGEVTMTPWWLCVSIPVPSETFYFYAATDSSSEGNIYLSFYLTWA